MIVMQLVSSRRHIYWDPGLGFCSDSLNMYSPTLGILGRFLIAATLQIVNTQLLGFIQGLMESTSSWNFALRLVAYVSNDLVLGDGRLLEISFLI